jgi:hypothetical protein
VQARAARRQLAVYLLLWLLFFAIGVGFGYPAVRYYDPRSRGPTDSAALYHDLLTGQTPRLAGTNSWHYENRILVPMLARPVYALVRGRSGSWEPAFLALLLVNASLMASAATLLVHITHAVAANAAAGVLAAFLLYANFATPNFYLAALVDSAELTAFLVMTVALLRQRWWWLPAIAAVAVMAKETFLPLGTAFAAGWIAATWRAQGAPISAPLAVLAMTAVSTAVLTALAALRGMPAFWLRDVLPEPLSASSYLAGAAMLVTDRGLLYVFGWLVPLAAVSVRQLPRPWAIASLTAAAAAFGVGLINEEQTVNRALMNVAGPMLCAAGALTLLRMTASLRRETVNASQSPR